MTADVIIPRKLIEVSLPLNAINSEAALRKRKAPAGYPTSIHKWWAQRPIAATRAVIFAQMVNDPSWRWDLEHPGESAPSHLRATWARSRRRLFQILEKLVRWENSLDSSLLQSEIAEIRKSWRETCEANQSHPNAHELFNPDRLPVLHDPFAGGGSIPLEAQRLGFEVSAADLNPVAVLINKAMVEIPGRFSGNAPINAAAKTGELMEPRWHGAAGLVNDLLYYGGQLREEAERRIGHLFPKFEITDEVISRDPRFKALRGQRLTVVAWIWTRTIKSPDPAYRTVDVPLASTFVLSNQPGREAYVEPVVDDKGYRFTVRFGKPGSDAKQGTKLRRGASFRCLMSKAAIEPKHIYSEAKKGRMGARLMAIVVESPMGRTYVAPTNEQELAAANAVPAWKPDLAMPDNPRWFSPPLYGLPSFGDLFTPRQLVCLNTLTELIEEFQGRINKDAIAAGLAMDSPGLNDGGSGALAYAEALSVYLAFVMSRVLHYGSTACTWLPKDNAIARTFTKQAIQMTWDFAEGNLFGKSSTEWSQCCKVIAQAIEFLPSNSTATVSQEDAATDVRLLRHAIISTDPPYYDNVGYADLSDFFYVWLRRCMRKIYPGLFATVAVPKSQELVAIPYRHGGKTAAEDFFLDGMTKAMTHIAQCSHPGAPVTIYYAFKQSETDTDSGTSSTGWETFLGAVTQAGFAITGTWPLRTEGDNRQVGLGTNALASSVLLVCRRRPSTARAVGRREFTTELRQTLPRALEEMTVGDDENRSPVAPVDLSQAIIGPGMAVFSKYAAVQEADGSPMTVTTALRLINRYLADDDFDADTQFCIAWFEEHGWDAGPFGSADILARAKGTSVDGVRDAGVVHSSGGSVRLTKWADYPSDWDPSSDTRQPVWEVLHHLIRTYRTGGETAAALLLALVQRGAGQARQLAYRLYTLCERAGWTEDARAYNELITGWDAIEAAATAASADEQQTLFNG